ncbi:hypothetical protein HYDPIDRAFT_116883 [Hydnomerulius pinastri MD-312]|uniref:Uncharacterized protein n=1 Tax=Hydnomerulius pinastri MD-312 TaxID=994086 RepID=A0A0C9VSE6_9AGAM|nr:hypothetical protein HYDPIDRAFT_116883 [Hydnomerulius pinastri MD-312]
MFNGCSLWTTAIVFSAREGEVVSSCSSLEVAAQEILSSNEVLLCRSTAAHIGPRGAQPHAPLLQEWPRVPLESSDKRMQACGRSLPLWLPARRGAALSNLAMAKFISCQAREAHLDLDEPISLFREALDLRPPHNTDHPCTLINLSIALLAREPRRLIIRQAR